jgi:hypothetical protein
VLDDGGRLPSGQTVEAFVAAVAHAQPLAIGINCGSGSEAMGPALVRLAAAVGPGCGVSCCPNAGLPDAEGRFPESEAAMAAVLSRYAASGLVSIVGGCCGTTPEYTRALVAATAASQPSSFGLRREEKAHGPPSSLLLSGLECVTVAPGIPLRVLRPSRSQRGFLRECALSGRWPDAVACVVALHIVRLLTSILLALSQLAKLGCSYPSLLPICHCRTLMRATQALLELPSNCALMLTQMTMALQAPCRLTGAIYRNTLMHHSCSHLCAHVWLIAVHRRCRLC